MLPNTKQMLNGPLSLPKACSEFTRRGGWRLAGKCLRSLDLTPIPLSRDQREFVENKKRAQK
jgi:hypothetical protein